ncbi:protein SIEVE ELEMENT OCCLUSION C-like isoform X2 [Magnolia sinica]|nr:protein SIEVE ELEMENT OCCLUSION C-like isoform X2 [Magnolia sinica]
MMTKCSGDSHATTMMVFDLLGSHSWDGKLVLVIAAFAVSYGELFLITRQKSSIGVRWELWSLVHKVRNTHGHLRKQLDACYQCIEAKLHHTLLSLFEETNDDNLKVLGMLLALKDDLPLWDGYLQEQICIDVLKSKIVLLLLSKIDISIAQVLLLQQTYDHPHRKSEKSYEIVWIPFQSSVSWNHLEVKAFNQVANTVPWYSICRPWLLSSAVLNYMKEEWNYEDEPLIVVLDQQGRIICPNAMDMVIIWGGDAYPFSTSREKQLWGEARWTLELIMGDIDPLMSMWIKEGRTICLYGSDNINWIREFSSKMKSIIRAGVSLELIYVGNGNPGEHVREILDTITKENLSRYLPQTKIHFFWIRLNSMRSSKKRLGKDIQNDSVMEEVMSLLSHGIREEGWAVMGRGSSTDIIQLHGRKLMECLTLFPVWGDNIEKVGLLNAIRKAFDPAQDVVHCHHSRIVPYAEGTDEGLVICDECKRPMEKRILYQCLQYPGTNG